MNFEFNGQTINEIEEYFTLIARLDEDENPTQQLNVLIEKGPFKGCVIEYGKMQMQSSDDDEEEVRMMFEYNIVKVPDELKNVKFTDEQGEEFEVLVGNILMTLLHKTYNDNQEDNEQGENRESNSITIN